MHLKNKSELQFLFPGSVADFPVICEWLSESLCFEGESGNGLLGLGMRQGVKLKGHNIHKFIMNYIKKINSVNTGFDKATDDHHQPIAHCHCL